MQMNSLLKWKCRVPGNTPVSSGTDVHKNLQVSGTNVWRITIVMETIIVQEPFTHTCTHTHACAHKRRITVHRRAGVGDRYHEVILSTSHINIL